MSAESIADLWEQDHTKHPGMAKKTFVQNYLFANHFDDLIEWLHAQEDLQGEILGSSYQSFRNFIEGEVGADGFRPVKADREKPWIAVCIKFEVVKGGHSKLLDPGPSYHDCDC